MAPVDLVDRLLSYYRKHDEAKKPTQVIQPATAAFLSISYVLIYVLPFYLSSKTRPSPTLSRDAPSVIRARIRAVSFACLITLSVTTAVATRYAGLSLGEVLKILGVWPIDPVDIARSFSLVAVLFAGPLFEAGFADGRIGSWLSGRALRQTFSDTIGWRNYVAGPLSEELVFRAAILPLHLFSKEAPGTLVFATPLYFGIAHIHHFYEFKLTHPHMPLLPSVLRSVFQLTYTTVFGWLAAFLYLRTGSVWVAVLAHAFCNWMGLPRLWGRVERESDAEDNDKRKKPQQLSIVWSWLYYMILVAGAVLFFVNLWNWTESPNALVTFSKESKASVSTALHKANDLKNAAQAAAMHAKEAAEHYVHPVAPAPAAIAPPKPKPGPWQRWNIGGLGTGHANF